MDRMENARQRLTEGGFVVISNLPSGAHLGVDCQTYEVGPKCRGLKMIPPGIHLLHLYRLGGAEEIQGLWFKSHPGSVLALEWDACTEASYDGLCAALFHMEIDTFLAPYPEEQHATWKYLTSMVTQEVLNECGMPLETKVLPGGDYSEERRDVVGNKLQDKLENNINHVSSSSMSSFGNIVSSQPPDLAQVPRFVSLGKALGDAEAVRGLSPLERTRQNMDRSSQLQSIILERFFGDWKRLLGELQCLTVLLCSCDVAIRESSEVLHSQLKQIPEDFFTSELTSNNFLLEPLGALFETLLGNSDTSPELSAAARKLLGFVQKKFCILKRAGPAARLQGPREVLAAEDWSLMIGTCEDGPAIVPYEEVIHVMGSDSEKRSNHVPPDVMHVEQRAPEDRLPHHIPTPDTSRVDAVWAKVDASLGIQASSSQIGRPPNNNNNNLFAMTYPNLVASIETGEDVLMAAARLLSDDGERVAGSTAQQEAKLFIEREASDPSGPLWEELSLLGIRYAHVD